jgi:hypothetical protein
VGGEDIMEAARLEGRRTWRVAGSMEGRGGSLLEPPWSRGSGCHGVGERVTAAVVEKKRVKGGSAVEVPAVADAK